jgi:hypothetical protein
MPKKIEKKTDPAPQKESADSAIPDKLNNRHGITIPSAVLQAFYWTGTILCILAGLAVSLGFHILTSGLASAGIAFIISGLVLNFAFAIPSPPSEVRILKEPELPTNSAPKRLTGWQALRLILFIIVIGNVAAYGFFRLVYYLGYRSGEASYILPAPNNTTQQLPDGRILLTDVTPEYLKSLFYTNTNADAKQLMNPYWDKWLKFNGLVTNKTVDPKYVILQIGRPEPYKFLTMTFNDPQQMERVKPLTRGNPAAMLCKIKNEGFDFSMHDCELLDN